MSKKPSDILNDSIRDIDNGLWLCGVLDCHSEENSANPKHMGCAIGLVSIHSGHTVTVGGTKYAKYLSDGEPTEEALETVEFLYNAIPSKYKGIPREFPFTQERVINFNDTQCKTPQDAKEWFEKAKDLAILEGK